MNPFRIFVVVVLAAHTITIVILLNDKKGTPTTEAQASVYNESTIAGNNTTNLTDKFAKEINYTSAPASNNDEEVTKTEPPVTEKDLSELSNYKNNVTAQNQKIDELVSKIDNIEVKR